MRITSEERDLISKRIFKELSRDQRLNLYQYAYPVLQRLETHAWEQRVIDYMTTVPHLIELINNTLNSKSNSLLVDEIKSTLDDLQWKIDYKRIFKLQK